MAQKYSNHLAKETSPYLLQHAHNPVNWYPWGKEALDKAKEQDKMILVSIGYSACHWCHVMERESFENEDTAAIMNEHFVNIKIDREERPDLDHIYMDAVQAISGSGGWPLNVFLTPQAKPFYGGTYFPPVRAFNRSSWREVLHSLAQSWKEKRNEIEAQAENLTEHISKAGNFSAGDQKIFDLPFESEFDSSTAKNIFLAMMKPADRTWGGFGRAPKFPQTFVINYLLEFYHHTGEGEALQQALLSIDKMLEGGIYDHLAGGLARYSTDEEWLAPHFEKMLYDNALLLSVLCDALQVTGQKKYGLAIRKTISFLQNEMLHPQGGFYAALDADSEGEEGKFYVWDKAEVDNILGEDAALFCDFFNITATGNWEGKNILRILKNEAEFVKEHVLDPDAFREYIEACTRKLLSHRQRRVRPGLDDKIILGWNALAIKAVAKAAIVLQDEVYKQLAVNTFNFLLGNFKTGNGFEMNHTWKAGVARYPAFLDDYAGLIAAALEMYKLTLDTTCLDTARELASHVIGHFGDEEGVFFYYTHREQPDVITRKKELYDSATPSGNAIMAQNLHELSVIFDLPEWRTRAENMVRSIAGAIIKYPSSFAIWASLLLRKIQAVPEIALTGKGAIACAREIQSGFYLPGALLMVAERGNNSFPILENKKAEDFFQIFVCRNYVCGAPVTSIKEFEKAIKSV